MIEPLRFEFDVACALEHAFDVWTARIAQWWPLDHTVSVAEGLDVVLEPKVGGRIFERTPDGIEHVWGEVTAWERLDVSPTSGICVATARTRQTCRSRSRRGTARRHAS